MLRGKDEALCSLSVDLLRFCYFFATDNLIATNVLAYTFFLFYWEQRQVHSYTLCINVCFIKKYYFVRISWS